MPPQSGGAMARRQMILASLIGGALAMNCAARADDDGGCRALPIYRVDDVGCYVTLDRVIIIAEGRTRTSGWSDPSLRLEAISDDGQSVRFAFLACRPEGVVLQALWKSSARIDLDRLARPTLERVTVTSETASQTASCRNRPPPIPKP